MQTRRTFLGASCFAAALGAQSAAPQPNVIFILADDMGWGDLSHYGNPRAKTPTIDRLAAQGTLFTQFYVNGSAYSPTCSAFLAGMYPARNPVMFLSSRLEKELVLRAPDGGRDTGMESKLGCHL